MLNATPNNTHLLFFHVIPSRHLSTLLVFMSVVRKWESPLLILYLYFCAAILFLFAFTWSFPSFPVPSLSIQWPLLSSLNYIYIYSIFLSPSCPALTTDLFAVERWKEKKEVTCIAFNAMTMQGSWTLIYVSLRVASGMILHHEFCWMLTDSYLWMPYFTFLWRNFFLIWPTNWHSVPLRDFYPEQASILYSLYQWNNKWRSCEVVLVLSWTFTSYKENMVTVWPRDNSVQLVVLHPAIYPCFIPLFFP